MNGSLRFKHPSKLIQQFQSEVVQQNHFPWFNIRKTRCLVILLIACIICGQLNGILSSYLLLPSYQEEQQDYHFQQQQQQRLQGQEHVTLQDQRQHKQTLHNSSDTNGDDSAKSNVISVPTAQNASSCTLFARKELCRVAESIQQSRTALLYSPYHFSMGGGEKYFLTTASFFQKTGYRVTILSDKNNYCQNKHCVLKTASQLNISLSSNFNYFLVNKEDGKMIREKISVDIYYEMGNSKYPQFYNPGNFGIYQCQFPFDKHKKGTKRKRSKLTTFQLVLVNSEYTKMNYLESTLFDMLIMNASNWTFPNVEVLNPPVSLLSNGGSSPKLWSNTSTTVKRIRIAMLGRIFEDRQSKGHMSAIQAMREISAVTDQVELHVVGAIHPGFEAYAKNLTMMAKGLNIRFHFSVSRDKLSDVLNQAQFFWHLTGLETNGKDPASNEHFGISPVEAISLGLVPIHFSVGGVSEATKNCGFPIDTVDDLVQTTLQLTELTPDRYALLSATCQQVAQEFTVENFYKRLERVLHRNRLTHSFFQRMMNNLPYVNSNISTILEKRSQSPQHIAYIYVHSPSYQLTPVLKNIMGTLGPDWDLWVGVTPIMQKYVEPFVEPFGAKIVIHQEMNGGTVEDYNKLLMSATFWESFPSEHILVFQHDTVLLYNNIDLFLRANKPLVGALWCDNNEIWKDHIVSWRVGNGGLSLRRKSWMLECVRSPSVKDNYNRLKAVYGTRSGPLKADNEDIFFNVCVQTLINNTQELNAIEQLSKEFAVEVPCDGDDFAKRGPMGAHSVWYYSSSQQMHNLISFGRQWTENMTESEHALQISS